MRDRERADAIRAISLWQPWASLMAFGEKVVETRGWTTKYRGVIAIAATQKEPPDWLGVSRHRQQFGKFVLEVTNRHRWGEGYWSDSHHSVSLGAVLCLADLVQIIPTEQAREGLSEQELAFGKYDDGRYAWFFGNVRRFKTPIPAKGNRMIWYWKPPQRTVELADGSTLDFRKVMGHE